MAGQQLLQRADLERFLCLLIHGTHSETIIPYESTP
jgi:hypothetical protein